MLIVLHSHTPLTFNNSFSLLLSSPIYLAIHEFHWKRRNCMHRIFASIRTWTWTCIHFLYVTNLTQITFWKKNRLKHFLAKRVIGCFKWKSMQCLSDGSSMDVVSIHMSAKKNKHQARTVSRRFQRIKIACKIYVHVLYNV